MEKTYKSLLGVFLTIVLTLGLLLGLTKLMEDKSSATKYYDFFDQDANFDVLFLGTSHVIYGIYPMELWDKYGIISYNIGGHASRIPTTYWTMENSLNYTSPQVVVIDCLYATSDYKCCDNFSYLHQSFDAFPLSATKIKTVFDLLDDEKLEKDLLTRPERTGSEHRTKIGLLWDYSVYHSRWSQIDENDFSIMRNREKGAEYGIAVAEGELKRIEPSLDSASESVGEQYLRKMIEECQSKGIDVLLVFLPFPANENEQKDANFVYQIASEYGVDYINFLDMDLINYKTDLLDANSHLNVSGARKVTDYLGQYLLANYNGLDRKNDRDYSWWTSDYSEYCNLKDEYICNENSLKNYLMLLSNDNIDVKIVIDNQAFFEDDLMVELIGNIGVPRELLATYPEEIDIINDSINISGTLPKEKYDTNVNIHISVERDGDIVDDVVFENVMTQEGLTTVNINR